VDFKEKGFYSSCKLFFPVSAGIILVGVGYYLYTLASFGRFTNMSLLMFVSSIIVFLVGLVSEQISNLKYKDD